MRLLMFVLLLGISASAVADDRTAVTRTIDLLADCRKISADPARLACFDKAIAGVESARSKGDLLVLDRAKVVERRRAQFGLGGADAGIGGEEVRTIETTIADVAQAARYGRWHLQLANGQVWETIDPLRFTPKKGETLSIRAAAFGAFRASFARQNSQVKRIK